MKRSSERLLTTHVGSLARPRELLELRHAHNIVEHPLLIADLLVTYARLVGRENLIAGADCGFSSTATFAPEVDPKVVWAKFQASQLNGVRPPQVCRT